jgi:hypothetical protein
VIFPLAVITFAHVPTSVDHWRTDRIVPTVPG